MSVKSALGLDDATDKIWIKPVSTAGVVHNLIEIDLGTSREALHLRYGTGSLWLPGAEAGCRDPEAAISGAAS